MTNLASCCQYYSKDLAAAHALHGLFLYYSAELCPNCASHGSFDNPSPMCLEPCVRLLTLRAGADLPQLPSHVPAVALLCKDVDDEADEVAAP